MTLSDLSIKNPVFAVMLSTAMIVFGYLGYRDMGISQFPEIDFPVVSITTYREQAAPETMDFDVTDFIEDAVSGVEGIDYIQSQSLEGVAVTTVFFRLSRDIDAAMQDVQNAVSAAMNRLPNDIDPPIISKINFNKFPVIWLSIHGHRPIQEINRFVDDHLKQQIETIPGCGGVMYGGLRPRNMRIWLDADKLQSFNLDALDVMRALRIEHVEKPAGYLKGNLREINVRVMGEARTPAEFVKIPLVNRSGQIITLGDVAHVEDGLFDYRSFARFNRETNVGVGVMRATGANVVEVCDEVKRRLPILRKMLPPGMEIGISTDYSLFIKEDIDEVNQSLLSGIILTAVVTFLFLGSIGTTFNVCISIPTSLVGTFVAMRWFGFTINFMTLLALSLSVGVVVDDAILVLENIYRRREHGEGRKEAAVRGAREISFAAIAATLSIAAIFIPVAFMKGAIGRFFFQFGITCTVAVLLSLVVSLTITPMLCSYFLDVREKKPPRPGAPRLPLAWTVGVLVVVIGIGLRLTARAMPGLTPLAWPLVKLAGLFPWGHSLPDPTQVTGLTLGWLWLGETFGEFVLAVLLTRFGPFLYWAVDRFFLEPLFITPMNWLMDRLTRWYAVVLRVGLRHTWYVVPASLLLASLALLFVFGLSVPLPSWLANLTGKKALTVKAIGRELVPSEDQNRFVINVICPVGSSIDYVSGMLARGEDVLIGLKDPTTGKEVCASVFAAVSVRPGSLISEGTMFVRLIPADQRGWTQTDVINEVRKRMSGTPGMRAVVLDLSTQGFTPTRGYPVNFAVQGPDWKTVTELADRIKERMTDSGVVTDVNSDYRPGQPEVHVLPDREKAAELGIPIQRLAFTINVAFGGVRNGRFTDLDKRYDVRLRYLEQQRASPDQLSGLYVKTDPRSVLGTQPKNAAGFVGATAMPGGSLVPLEDLAGKRVVSTLPLIPRYNHLRKVEITANMAPGISQGEAIARSFEIANEVREEMELPESYRIVPMGNAQAMKETIDSMWAALALGFVVASMILGVQFNSFVHPFTVLIAVPFGVTGALAMLWLAGDTLNLMSMIGMVLLAGLVKKNSIILVDYTNQLRQQEGLSLKEAVLKACPIRLRPILMTSLATMASALPLALGIGPGAETRAPLARSIIGGIFLSTLVTLVIVPIFYVLFDRFGAFVRRLSVRKAPVERPEQKGWHPPHGALADGQTNGAVRAPAAEPAILEPALQARAQPAT
jgi:multidrug efflux pump subunit AcrB